MKYIEVKSRVAAFFVVVTLICAACASSASAEIIDDITLHADASGEIDAVIKFSVPIQFVRHFPQGKSPYVVIYFNILNTVPRDEWQNYESHRSPPSDFIVGFAISTRDVNTGPKVQIQFDRPVEYDVSAGKSGRSLIIHFKKPEKKRQDQPVAGEAAVAVLPAVQPPASLPALKPSVTVPPVTPKEAAPAKATATQPAKPVVIPSKLGPRDGLPAFPVIELPVEEAASSAPAETPTLEAQIKIANGQAAVQMAKGQDALLAGQPFAAIEAFNSALNLPPNKYSQDAQVWIGIAREKSGQPAKAKLEYESYLKLYPQGTLTPWVKERLAKLNLILPRPAPTTAVKPAAPIVQPSEFHTSTYGSLSMYYYNGSSRTDTVSTVNGVQVPTSLTVNDQSALFTSVMTSLRSYNNEFDNRLVFQDMYLKNFLPNGQDKNRLTAAYAEVKNRISNYSVRVGRRFHWEGSCRQRCG